MHRGQEVKVVMNKCHNFKKNKKITMKPYIFTKSVLATISDSFSIIIPLKGLCLLNASGDVVELTLGELWKEDN